MNINITGHHIEVTAAIRDYVDTKLDRVISRFDNVISVHVILSVDKLDQKAEITLRVKGRDIYAESINADLYAAIDILVDKLNRQVVKYKEKQSNHAHEGHKRQVTE